MELGCHTLNLTPCAYYHAPMLGRSSPQWYALVLWGLMVLQSRGIPCMSWHCQADLSFRLSFVVVHMCMLQHSTLHDVDARVYRAVVIFNMHMITRTPNSRPAYSSSGKRWLDESVVHTDCMRFGRTGLFCWCHQLVIIQLGVHHVLR